MEQKWTKIATISKTHERILANDIGISKHLLRQICASRQIHVIKAGNVSLINWDNLMDFLNGNETYDPKETRPGVIKKIPENLTMVR